MLLAVAFVNDNVISFGLLFFMLFVVAFVHMMSDVLLEYCQFTVTYETVTIIEGQLDLYCHDVHALMHTCMHADRQMGRQINKYRMAKIHRMP